MSFIVNGYEPEALFHYFEEICKIPHSSGNEKEISDFLVNFAKKHNLEYYQDEIYNVIIKKAGKNCHNTNSNAIILQGHMDMVCEKNADTLHSFERDPLKLKIVNGSLFATGTTLGADNGIAVAMMLAILSDDKLVHPPLECVFTVQEETGLCGAANLDGSKLLGRTMINLDSEDEGIATVSCAGGMRVRLSREISVAEWGSLGLTISLKGLNGGHSGTDIALERGNANKLIGRILYALNDQVEMRLCAVNGGSKDNAIPREAQAVVMLNSAADADRAIEIIRQEANDIANELSGVEQELAVDVTPTKATKAMDKQASNSVIGLLYFARNGILNRNVKAGGFTVRSINLGVVKTIDDKVTMTFAPRSSISTLQNQTKKELKLLSELFGFEMKIDSEYPGWSYAEVSPIREVFMNCYREQYGEELQVEAIHAGLECGLFCEKLQGLDTIAVGPTINNCHTPNESMDLLSCQRTYKLLILVLSRLAN